MKCELSVIMNELGSNGVRSTVWSAVAVLLCGVISLSGWRSEDMRFCLMFARTTVVFVYWRRLHIPEPPVYVALALTVWRNHGANRADLYWSVIIIGRIAEPIRIWNEKRSVEEQSWSAFEKVRGIFLIPV